MKILCVSCGELILPETANANDGICSCCLKKKKESEGISALKERGGCPQCNGRRYGAFNSNFKSEEFEIYRAEIRFEADVPLGKTLRCRSCRALWFLDVDGMMNFVEKSKETLINEWSKRDLSLKSQFSAILLKIGANPTDVHGNGSDNVEFPCSVRTTKGEHFEKAIVSFRKVPPLESMPFRFVDELISIAETDFAVSREVRAKYKVAAELRNGFCPTPVETPEGISFSLSGFVNLFERGSCKGKNLVLASEVSMTDVVAKECKGVVYFIGWWNENLEPYRLA